MIQRCMALMLCVLLAFALCGCGKSNPTPGDAGQQMAAAGLDIRASLAKLDLRSSGAEVGKWTSDASAAMKLAQEKQLPLLVFFGASDWNPTTSLLIDLIFAEAEWKDYAASRLVLLFLDMPRHTPDFPAALKEQNAALARKWGVRTQPAVFLFDPVQNDTPAAMLDINLQPRAKEALTWARRTVWTLPSIIDRDVREMKNPAVQSSYQAWRDAQKKAEAAAKAFQESQQAVALRYNDFNRAREEWVVSRRSPEERATWKKNLEEFKRLRGELEAAQKEEGPVSPERTERIHALQQRCRLLAESLTEILLR